MNHEKFGFLNLYILFFIPVSIIVQSDIEEIIKGRISVSDNNYCTWHLDRFLVVKTFWNYYLLKGNVN
jgi:hypothetical protein